MYRAMVFLGSRWFQGEGKTPEEPLAQIEKRMKVASLSGPLTYRPADGTIYWNWHHIPCGVVFKVAE